MQKDTLTELLLGLMKIDCKMIPTDTHKLIAMSHLIGGTTDGNLIHAAVEIVAAWVERKEVQKQFLLTILK